MRPPRRAAVVLASGLFALAGCRRASGDGDSARWSRCACAYVTDYDQPGRAVVEVCAAGDDAAKIAAPCAQGLGVGVVTTCACEAPAAACDGAIGTCREEPDEPK